MYYQYHVFVCTNRRENQPCCADLGGEKARQYLKQKCKELGIHGAGQVRINQAGCLDRCELGPVLVIYPEETWYTFVDQDDLDEIIAQHLQQGKIVERLELKKDLTSKS